MPNIVPNIKSRLSAIVKHSIERIDSLIWNKLLLKTLTKKESDNTMNGKAKNLKYELNSSKLERPSEETKKYIMFINKNNISVTKTRNPKSFINFISELIISSINIKLTFKSGTKPVIVR